MYMTDNDKVVITLHANAGMTREQIRRLQGQPVCVVMKDGSYYLGWITGIEGGEVVMSGRRGSGTMSRSSVRQAEKALVSGFMPGFMGSMFGGGQGMGPFGFQPGAGFPFGNAAAANPGGAGNQGGGLMDMVGKWWPKIRMGIGMMQTILPLLGGLKL